MNPNPNLSSWTGKMLAIPVLVTLQSLYTLSWIGNIMELGNIKYLCGWQTICHRKMHIFSQSDYCPCHPWFPLMYPSICCPVLADGARYSYRSSNRPEEQKRAGRGENWGNFQFSLVWTLYTKSQLSQYHFSLVGFPVLHMLLLSELNVLDSCCSPMLQAILMDTNMSALLAKSLSYLTEL